MKDVYTGWGREKEEEKERGLKYEGNKRRKYGGIQIRLGDVAILFSVVLRGAERFDPNENQAGR